jgi:hypothetical protein
MAAPDLDSQEHVHRLGIAGRTGLRKRIRDELRVSERFADLIVDEWEAEAIRRGIAPLDKPYWSEGAQWVAARFLNRDLLD